MNRLPGAGAVFVAILTTSCAAALQRLPEGPGAPAADAADAFAQATAACHRITSLSAELAVSGRAGGQRLRGRVLVGLAAPSSAYLDAAAPFGASLFIYAARDRDATLLLPRDQRVLLQGDPAAVLEAVAGVPLDASELRHTLTGCAPDSDVTAGRQFGDSWRVVSLASGSAYLRRAPSNAQWRLVAVTREGAQGAGWRADYLNFEGDLPRTVHLVSLDAGRRFDLTLSLSQVEVNPQLGPEVFEVRVPPSASPITLDELRRAGPLGEPRE
jgi:outer membrane lipoprotein-sorting protein